MSENATVIKEIRAQFTANISDYRSKMAQLSSVTKRMTQDVERAKRTANAAMNSPSAATQKMGRALDATARKLEQQRARFDELGRVGERTAQKMGQATDALGRMTAVQDAIKNAAKSVDLSTPIEKQVESAAAEMQRLDVEVETLRQTLRNVGREKLVFVGNDLMPIEQANVRMNELITASEQAADRYLRLKGAMDAIGGENLKFANAKGLDQLKAKIEATETKLNEYGDRLTSTAAKAEQLAGSMQRTRRAMDEQSGSLNRASRAFDLLRNGMRKIGSSAGGGLSTVRNHIVGIGRGASNSVSNLERLVRSIRRISIVSLGLRLIRPIFGELASTVNLYMEQNQAAAASIERLRNGLANALAPAINVVINLLNQVMPYLVGIADAVASLITNIFGTGWTTVSTGAGAAADKVDDLAGSTNNAAAAQEKYNKLIAGFDEITKLEDQSSGSGGGGGSPGGGATQTTAPGTEGIAGKLPEWLDGLKEKLAGIFDVFKKAWDEKGQAVIDAAKGAFDALKAAAVDVGNTFYDVFTDGTGQTWVESILGVLESMLNVVESIAKTFKEAWDSDGTGRKNITALFDALTDVNDLAADLLGSFAKVWDESGLGESIWKNILDAITGAYNTVGNLATQIKSAWDSAGVGEGIWKGILKIVDDITGFVKDIAEDTAEWAKNLNVEPLLKSAKNVIDSIEKVVAKLAESAKGFYEKFIQPLASFVIDTALPVVLDGIAAALDLISKIPASLITDVFTAVVVGVGSIKAIDKFEETVNLIKGLGTSIAQLGTTNVPEIALTITLSFGVTQAVSGFSGLYALLFGTEEEKQAARDDAEKSLFWPIGKGLADMLNSAWEGISGFWNSIPEWWDSYLNRPGGPNEMAAEIKKNVGAFWDTLKGAWDSTVKTLEAGIELVKSGWNTVKEWVNSSGSGTVFQYVELVKNGWKSVVSWVKNTGDAISAKIALKKNGWKSISGYVGTSTSVKVNLKKGSGFSVKTTAYGLAKSIFKGLTGGIRFFARGGVVNKPTPGIFGESGREAIVPLENNTEWTGVVANLITRQMNSIPVRQTGAAFNYSGGKEELGELVMLIRELRSDVAALRQEGKQISVTVKNDLDGKQIANNTVKHIINQTRATGTNPLSAYI